MSLTVKEIEAFTPDPTKHVMHADGDGLYLKITKHGGMLWVYRYTYAGKRREMSLGTWPELKLKEARGKRLDQTRILDDGKDPGALKQEARKAKLDAVTLEELGELYFEKWLKAHYEKPEDAYALLKRDPIRVHGKRLAMDLTARHFNEVFDEMVKRDAKVSANRCLSLTKKMLDWAVEREHLEANPLSKRTTKSTGGSEKSKEVHLLFEQIKDVLGVLSRLKIARGRHGVALETVMGLRLILGTGKRPLEVVTWQWKHIDWENKRWINPSHLTKEKRGDHVVFLSKYVLNVLKVLRKANPTSKYVLPSPTWDPKSGRPEKPITRHTLSRAVLRLHERELFAVKFTPHDMRRTFSTRAADLKIGPHIVEKCLDHVMTGSMAVYNRGSYFDEREEAMRIWGEKLQELDQFTVEV